MQQTEIEISLPGGIIKGMQWNPSSPAKALLFHGWLDNCESFHSIAPLLAKKYHVVALDIAGHGKSFHRTGIYGYLNQDFLVDTHFIINELQWPVFDFICHSMGASIAAVYASIFPDRVQKLFLLDAYLPLTAEATETIDKLQSYVKTINRVWKKKAREFGRIEDAVQVRFDATPDLPIETCRKIVERNLSPLENGFKWCFDEKLKLPSPLRFTMDHILKIDQAITCPVKLFLGTESPYQGFHGPLKEHIGDRSTYELIEFKTGHYPHVEKPEEISQIILQS